MRELEGALEGHVLLKGSSGLKLWTDRINFFATWQYTVEARAQHSIVIILL